ncbi:hypothetical protein BX600DRAFT_500739 [Xylariales sp. PMI_506]|nr:hypothetical protein BX600DRAFT_500739 [Xylariales sp. PMI_506]
MSKRACKFCEPIEGTLPMFHPRGYMRHIGRIHPEEYAKYRRAKIDLKRKDPNGRISPLAEFLTCGHAVLKPLVAAWKSVILRAGGVLEYDPDTDSLRFMQLSVSDLKFAEPNNSQPGNDNRLLVFNDKEVWVQKPSFDDLLNSFLHEFDQTKTQIYTRADPFHPVAGAPFVKVIYQLQKPDITSPYYAINMRSDCISLRLPERFAEDFPFKDEEPCITSNITPQYTNVDIHWDIGSQVVVTSGSKLWAFWPLSDYNTKLILKADQKSSLLLCLHDKLEGGSVILQKPGEALAHMAGWLHCTYTLEGAILSGIMYNSARETPWAANLLTLETNLGSRPNFHIPFARMVLSAFHHGTDHEIALALEILCKLHKYEKELRKLALWSEILENSTCSCGHGWKRLRG